MKPFRISLIAILALSIFSCSKDSDNNTIKKPVEVTPEDPFSGNIIGTWDLDSSFVNSNYIPDQLSYSFHNDSTYSIIKPTFTTTHWYHYDYDSHKLQLEIVNVVFNDSIYDTLQCQVNRLTDTAFHLTRVSGGTHYDLRFKR